MYDVCCMTKLSIIVPIYGVEQYLRKCVDSLLNQDISDYEIILVDDGGTDGCPAICDDYASPNSLTPSLINSLPKIRVIHRENGGLSAARNSGIEVAQGEYVMFVDSDDYIEPNVLGTLMEQIARDNLDVLRYDFRNVNEQYEEFHPNKDPKRDVDLNETVVDGETFLNERLGPGCYAWQFIIRRNLIIGHLTLDIGDCLFKEGIYFEDTEWTPRMLVRAKRVASTPTIVYDYLWREGSISLPNNPTKRKKVIEDKIALIRGFKEQSKMVKDSVWFKWMTSFTAMSVLDSITTLSHAERKTYIGKLKSLDIFPLYTAKEKIRSHKIKVQMANISPSLYCVIMRIRKRL